MAVVLKLKNFDELFLKSTNEKYMLNYENNFDNENKERLDQLIMSNYSSDNLSLIPSCSCGELKGAYYVGDRCSKCNTLTRSSIDDNLAFLIWLERPEGVQRFISPMILAILLNRYKISRPTIPLVQYIMLPNFRIDDKYRNKNNPQLDKLNFLLEKEGIKRGYNSFIENFFPIIKLLETNFSKANKAAKEEFYNWIFENRNNIFSNYLPFPNKAIFAVDANELGSFIDRSLLEPLNSIRRLTGIDLHSQPVTSKQSKVARSLVELSSFYRKYIENSFFIKQGLVRQHISSTRSQFTARAVITSIHGTCNYDDLHLPWSLSCTLFREHILKGLSKRGYNYKHAVDFYMFHNRTYSPVIHEIFNEILEAAGGAIEVLMIRNPSLHRGSVQVLRVVRFKTDVEDNTISLSFGVVRSYGADFDGDEMNLQMVLTKKARDQLNNLEPHHSVLSLRGPNEFGNAFQYPKTIISSLANWYNNGSDQ